MCFALKRYLLLTLIHTCSEFNNLLLNQNNSKHQGNTSMRWLWNKSFFLYIYVGGFFRFFFFFWLSTSSKQTLIIFIYNMCLIRHLQNRFKKFLYETGLSKDWRIYLFIFKLLMFSFRKTEIMRLARTAHKHPPLPIAPWNPTCLTDGKSRFSQLQFFNTSIF